MKEYIDRKALLKGLCDDDPSHMEDYYYNAIVNAPTADEEIADKLARISAQAQTNTDQALERILSGQ